MPTILKREFAPISDLAWKELDQQATDTILRNLCGRKVVDFDGPHGWDFAAVNLGRLKMSTKKAPGGVPWGIRQVQPLVEVWAPFQLSQLEVDNLTRGSSDADIGALQETVAKAAQLEDTAIFQGFADGGIQGIVKSSAHKAVTLPKDVEQYPKAVAEAVKAMALVDIAGPYALVLGPEEFFALKQAAKHGYPPMRSIQDLTEGNVLMSRAVSGGVLLSTRGGDFQLTVGKDYSLGYASHDGDKVGFFVTESFTFRVIEPQAAVVLKPSSR
jgi:uncharacterized linocin/CFP29 family protein